MLWRFTVVAALALFAPSSTTLYNAHAARARQQVQLGTLSGLRAEHRTRAAVTRDSGTASAGVSTSKHQAAATNSSAKPPSSSKALHAIKIDESSDDGPGLLGGGDQAIAIVFDPKHSWKADEQSLVSSALNRRYGIQTTALDAMRCTCSKSGDKESLLGSVDHTVSCDCM